jgi:DNA-binding GntR family transcriptional regulator
VWWRKRGERQRKTLSSLEVDPPKYIRVARLILGRIKGGTYPVGARLPAEIALAAEMEVSRETVRRALGLLREGGWIAVRQGFGSVVRREAEAEEGGERP